MRRRNSIVSLLLAMSVTFGLMGCASGNVKQENTAQTEQTEETAEAEEAAEPEETAESEETEQAQQEAESAEKVEFHILTAFDVNVMGNEYVDLLKQAADELGYTPVIENIDGDTYKTRIKVALSANELPDVFFTWGDAFTLPFIEADVLLPLNDAVEKSDLEYYPGYLTKWEDGNYYTAPYIANDSFIILYNKEIFEKADAAIPKSWDEFLAVTEKIKKSQPEVAPVLGTGRDRFVADLLYNEMVMNEDPAAYEKAMSGELSFTSEPFLNAAKNFQQLVDNEVFQPGYLQHTVAEAQELFFADKIAMYPIGTWALQPAIEKMGDKLGYFSLPGNQADYVENATVMFGKLPNGLCVSKNTKYPEQAQKFALKYSELINEASVKKARIPFIQTDTKPEVERAEALASYISDTGKYVKTQPWWYGTVETAIGEEMRDDIALLLYGEVTAEEYVEKLEETMSKAR